MLVSFLFKALSANSGLALVGAAIRGVSPVLPTGARVHVGADSSIGASRGAAKSEYKEYYYVKRSN